MKSEGPNLGAFENNSYRSLMGTQGKSIGTAQVEPFILILPLLPRLSAMLGCHKRPSPGESQAIETGEYCPIK